MAWATSGNIRGPEGPEGPAGPQGDVGPQGPTAQPTIASLSGASSHTFSGLDGDTDIGYEVILEGVLTSGGVARTITLRPNGVTTNTRQQGSTVQRDATGAITSNAGQSLTSDIGWRMGTDYGLGSSSISAAARVFARTGKNRQAIIDYAIKNAAATTEAQIGWRVYGSWPDTATNLTSLVIDFGGGTFTGRAILRKFGEVGPTGPQGPAASPHYGFRWYRSAALSQARGNSITWDAADFNYSGRSPTYEFVPPALGLWRFSWRVASPTTRPAASGPYWFYSYLTLNAVAVANGSTYEITTGQSSGWQSLGDTLVRITALTDFVRIVATWYAADTLAIVNDKVGTFFEGHYLGPVT